VELGDKMDLASYLLKPVQRMGKYALLLQQLMKAYPDKEVDVTDIRAAEQMVRFQLRHGNDLLAMDSLRDCDVSTLRYESSFHSSYLMHPVTFILGLFNDNFDC
jgi:hypothetical protein